MDRKILEYEIISGGTVEKLVAHVNDQMSKSDRWVIRGDVFVYASWLYQPMVKYADEKVYQASS